MRAWLRFQYDCRVRNAWHNRCWRCVLRPFHLTPDLSEADHDFLDEMIAERNPMFPERFKDVFGNLPRDWEG